MGENQSAVPCDNDVIRSDRVRSARVKVRSHQTRMNRYAQIIYMLSQCKDAIDNPAALFA